MPEPTPAPATQSVVVQPSAPAPLTANVGLLGEWAGAVMAIAAVVVALVKMVERMVGREIRDVRRDVGATKHKADNTATRVDALERLRAADVERIVRVEGAIGGIEKIVDRIDHRLETEFGQLSQSLRELRTVALRGDRP